MRGFIVGVSAGFLGLVVLWGMNIQIDSQIAIVFGVGMISGAIASIIVTALEMSKKK